MTFLRFFMLFGLSLLEFYINIRIGGDGRRVVTAVGYRIFLTKKHIYPIRRKSTRRKS
jgi:hypothetical protein